MPMPRATACHTASRLPISMAISGATSAAASARSKARRVAFELHHAFSRDGVALLEARELRVWAHADATQPKGMRAATIPREVVDLIAGPANGDGS